MADYSVMPMHKACSWIQDGTHFSPMSAETGRPYITSTNIRSGYLRLDEIARISESDFEEIHKRCPTISGDVWLTKDGAGCGNAAVNTMAEPAALLSSVAALRPDRSVLNAETLLEWLLSPRGQYAIRSEVGGNAITRITLTQIRELMITVPPVYVQSVIAKLHTDFMSADRVASELIASQRKRLRGLMQQLLTGRRRVPGAGATKAMLPSLHHREIPGDWGDVELGSVVKKISRRNTVGETHVLTASGEYGLVDQREFFNRSVAGADLSGYYLLKKGDFAYNRSRMKGYEYGAIKRLDRYEQGVLSTLYLCFAISSEGVDSDFLQWYFEGGQMGRQLRRVTPVGGRAHGLLNITDSDFYSIRIMLPPLEEQQAIAEILNTAQREIELLAQLREQIQLQKRGLMQKLLTGEIRVPADEPVTEEAST